MEGLYPVGILDIYFGISTYMLTEYETEFKELT